MSNTERRKILNYRNANGLSPNPDNIDYGEIAIGYKKDNEAIYIKNSTNEIVDFTPISIVNLTYNDLKNLRDNSKLKPSQYYRITDFVTTVANDPEARSAGHPFDIIVMASEKDKLQEECYAIQHEGDTYFADCNLAAWEIKYDLDNDTTKYAWADATNGKGVIYYMKDEFNNECPYDFKNIQFKRYKLKNQSGLHLADFPLKNSTTGGPVKQAFINWQSYLGTSMNSDNVSFYYTRGVYSNGYLVSGADIYTYNNKYGSYDGRKLAFNGSSGGSYVGLCSVYGPFDIIAEVEDINGEWFYTFSNKATATDAAVDASLSKLTNVECYSNSIKEYIKSSLYYLNNNIFIVLGSAGYIYSNNFNIDCYDNTFGRDCNSNTFGNNCRYNTFGNSCYSNTFKDSCYSNTFGNKCYSNTFKDSCYSNTFGNECYSNTFGNKCYNNTFGNSYYGNTFGNECDGNTFKDRGRYNAFGNKCYNNTFGNSYYGNTFGNDCGYNTFGDGCWYNVFGNDCGQNRFGNNCNRNVFGNDGISNTFKDACYNNTFGIGCESNTFGDECDGNTFGNECDSNKFGNYCSYNTFGNYCDSNTFGRYCDRNMFGNYCSSNLFSNHFEYNTLGNKVRYIAIPTEKIYHAQILNGTQGVNNNNKLTIEFTPETTYSQFAGFTSDNVLKTWVEADDPHDGVDCGYY